MAGMAHHCPPDEAMTRLGPGPALVFAPHPDDEVFGCGGAILRHVQAGDLVRVVIVTDGAYPVVPEQDRPDYADQRRTESRRAAGILGINAPEFWSLPDRELEYGEALIQKIAEAIAVAPTRIVYAPSAWEAHPDHTTLSNTVREAVRRSSPDLLLAYYEVGSSLFPNRLLDISDVWGQKEKAVQCFVSQHKVRPYDRHVAGLNAFRSYSVAHRGVVYCEAFAVFSGKELEMNADRVPGQVCGMYPQKMAPPGHAPLVSVIVRTMGRPELPRALDSIASQTYPNIEVVLVDALGTGEIDPGESCGRFPLRMVCLGKQLPRPHAANAGLDNARGDYICFLDEDDYLFSEHVSLLATTLGKGSELLAYSGISAVINGEQTVFNKPFHRLRLLWNNVIPIHAVMFHASLRDKGCHFDTSFDLSEDWDFLLQCSIHTHFAHLDAITGFYDAGKSGVWDKGDDHECLYWQRKIYEKWTRNLPDDEYFDFLRFQEQRVEYLEDVYIREQTITATLSSELQGLHASRSWRLTASLRRLGTLLRRVSTFLSPSK